MITFIQKSLIVLFPLSFVVVLLLLLPMGCETPNYKRFAEFHQSNSIVSSRVKVYDSKDKLLLDRDDKDTLNFFVKLLKFSSVWPDSLRDKKGENCSKNGDYSTYKVLLDTSLDNIEYWITSCESNIIEIYLIKHMGDTEYYYRYLPNEVIIPKYILDALSEEQLSGNTILNSKENLQPLTEQEKDLLRKTVYGQSPAEHTPDDDITDRVLLVPDGVSRLYKDKPAQTLDLLIRIVDGANPNDSLMAASLAMELKHGKGTGLMCTIQFKSTSYDIIDTYWKLTPRQFWINKLRHNP
ncbi:MAG: hypothetical protein R3B84_03750 [Zavarzinella sp.]